MAIAVHFFIRARPVFDDGDGGESRCVFEGDDEEMSRGREGRESGGGAERSFGCGEIGVVGDGCDQVSIHCGRSEAEETFLGTSRVTIVSTRTFVGTVVIAVLIGGETGEGFRFSRRALTFVSGR